MNEVESGRAGTRSRIVERAAQLLGEQGPAAVTTRGVAERAGVQAPTIYRLFGDKDGLLDAVAEHVLAEWVSAKAETVRAASASDVDPVADLRAGWEMQIAFGLANPAIFRLLADSGRTAPSPAAALGMQVLASRVHRVAVAGRLRVGEHRAVELIHAAGLGVVQTLLAAPPADRDPGLAPAMLDAVLARILDEAPAPAADGRIPAAVALRAAAPDLDALSGAERALLAEWLDRVVAAGTAPAGAEH
ncbi:TetR/AcrR family transcriptional regulator [Nakamurella flavida]|uniref:TetR/AcrR family transcriptional regulator n=1 Tax=Nakamurella flavida TaxID=363630 RepID=A0A939C2J8_9ACTN|nr:TetR/AcrR family transcriptional regulator [Nakamurella flavida]MBM9476655.1 TetR/AcrR family transcriptional regulator [Nakamurella flavida]MDP9778907.1 AcrR family transcriptional regulator [Nakamurella flavida]